MKTAMNISIFAGFIFLISIMLTTVAIAGAGAGPGSTYSVNSKPSTYLDFSIFDKEQRDLIEENLMEGINSNNLGLQVSSAYFLGELKSRSSKVIIPLLKLLRKGETEEARIIAAISLYKLDSGIGMYRLKWYSVHEENEVLRTKFQRIYNSYLLDKKS